MKILVLLTCLFFGKVSAQYVNYVGLPKDDIIKQMGKLNPGFDLDDGAVNNEFQYLKFVDKYNEETWLFFLTDNETCDFTKLMSDYSNLRIRTEELNKTFKNAGDNKWIHVEKGAVYVIELKKEEWFFTIVMKKKK